MHLTFDTDSIHLMRHCTLVTFRVSEKHYRNLEVSTLMTERVSMSETSVNIYQTTHCSVSGDSHIHIPVF